MEPPTTGVTQKSAASVAGAVTPERAAYYERIGKRNLAPLWEMLKGLGLTDFLYQRDRED